MKIYLGVGGDFSDDKLRFMAQIGVDGVYGTPRPSEGDNGFFSLETLATSKAKVEEYGLTFYSVRLAPWRWTFKWMLGLPGRDEQIENLQKTIRNMGELGIPIHTYNMHAMRYYRSSNEAEARGGAKSTSFNLDAVADAPVMTGGPAIDLSLIPEEYRKPVTDDEMWDNLKYFLDAVLPTAEAAGVKLALHPDDPPIPQIGHVARIMRSPEAYRKLLELSDSPANGIHFCQGCFTEMGADIPKEIEYFGSRGRIFAVDFRNIIGDVNDFREAFPDEGKVDMAEAMQAYVDVGFEGPICPDHAVRMTGDTDWGHRYWAYAIGHIRGLSQALER